MHMLRPSVGFGNGAALASDFSPLDAPLLVALFDCKSYQSVILEPTLTTPAGDPPIGLVGSPSRIVAPRILIEPSGTTFSWSGSNTGTGPIAGVWDQSGIPIPIANSYLAPGTGYSFVFPLGSYTPGHVYEGTLQTIRASNAANKTFTQTDQVKQARYLIDPSTGNPYLDADGVDDTYHCTTIDLPAPLTSPTWYYGIARWNARTQFDTLIAGGDILAYHLAIAMATNTANEISITNGLNLTISGVTLNAFKQFQAGFRNSAAGHAGADPAAWGDYLKVGSVAGTAPTNQVNTGANAPASGLYLFSRGESTSTFAKVSLPLLAIYAAYPTQALVTQFEAYGPAYWNASVAA